MYVSSGNIGMQVYMCVSMYVNNDDSKNRKWTDTLSIL